MELDNLYDQEQRIEERTGNREEKLFDVVYKAIKANKDKEDTILEMFRTTQDQINWEMSESEKKIKEFKNRVAKRETTLRIKSLNKQVEIYNNCINVINKEVL